MLRSRLANGDERRCLGQSVDLGDLPTEFAFDAADRGRGRRSAGRDHTHPSGELAAIFRWRAGQPDQHRRSRAEEAGVFAANELEHTLRLDPSETYMPRPHRRDDPGEGPTVG